jgi:hypothetical protein
VVSSIDADTDPMAGAAPNTSSSTTASRTMAYL